VTVKPRTACLKQSRPVLINKLYLSLQPISCTHSRQHPQPASGIDKRNPLGL
jgi:hypothetical protein